MGHLLTCPINKETARAQAMTDVSGTKAQQGRREHELASFAYTHLKQKQLGSCPWVTKTCFLEPSCRELGLQVATSDLRVQVLQT